MVADLDKQVMNIGEIYAIYLLGGIQEKSYRTRVLSHMRNGLTPYIVLVFEESKLACKFYEKHGGKNFCKNEDWKRGIYRNGLYFLVKKIDI